jgi:hypothetical protein
MPSGHAPPPTIEVLTMNTKCNARADAASSSITRRRLLRAGAAAALGWPLLSEGIFAEEKDAKGKKKSVLFFTKSAGFEHSVIKRTGDAPSHAGKALLELAKAGDFEVHETKDGRIFDSKDFDGFDAFFFYTTGDLTKEGNDKQPAMTEKGKARLLEAVAAGKGFIGSHCASDTFHTPGRSEENQERPDPYIALVGGEFISHGRQQKATMKVASPKFPGAEGLGESFELMEEWYSLKNFASDLHVILVNETEGMSDWQYERPPFPATWARRHEKGRVFYTSMGHREDVWTNPKFQALLTGGIQWALGRVEAETPANIEKATPKARENPKPRRKKDRAAETEAESGAGCHPQAAGVQDERSGSGG